MDPYYPFENFAPTLSQCFVIVVVGYLMARSGLLGPGDTRGVGAFAAYFAMPAIICASLAVADFRDFRWELLVGLYLGKLLLFGAVAGFWWLTNGNAGEAGALATFCTHSNDLPVGNPLMSSLYGDRRPQMMKYLFLTPAMTILLIAPLGTALIHIHERKRRDASSPEKDIRWRHLLLGECGGWVRNPVVLSTALGLAFHFAFEGRAPAVLLQPIRVAAATIPGLALSVLGFCFVGRERFLMSSSVVPAAVLLFLKMVLCPVISHTVLRVLTPSKLLSDFALLYSILSPASAILQSCHLGRRPLAAMSAALILSSFSCFPSSYVVARFTVAPVQNISAFVPLLKNVLFWVACCSLFFSVSVCGSMVIKRRWNVFPWCFVTFFALIQCLTPCGMLFWCLTENETWTTYCEMLLCHCGEISGYLWLSTLALLLVWREKREMSARKSFALLSFAVLSASALISIVMCVLTPPNAAPIVFVVGNAASSFEYLQLVTTSALLLINLIVVSGCLTWHFSKRRKRSAVGFGGHDNAIFYMQEQDEDSNVHFERNPFDSGKRVPRLGGSDEVERYYRGVVRGCAGSDDPADQWTHRLAHLLTIEGLVMSARLIANLYKVTRSGASEVMIPLEFFQSALFTGQGIILFLIFGIDLRAAAISFRKWWRKTWTEQRQEFSSKSANVASSDEAVHPFCRKFYKFYFNRCFVDIAKERKWQESVHRDCFWGHQLVEWMVSEGVCGSAAEAERRGDLLLAGAVIGDVARTGQPFADERLFYFVGPNGDGNERRKTGIRNEEKKINKQKTYK